MLFWQCLAIVRLDLLLSSWARVRVIRQWYHNWSSSSASNSPLAHTPPRYSPPRYSPEQYTPVREQPRLPLMSTLLSSPQKHALFTLKSPIALLKGLATPGWQQPVTAHILHGCARRQREFILAFQNTEFHSGGCYTLETLQMASDPGTTPLRSAAGILMSDWGCL